MKILVCGSRDWVNWRMIRRVLEKQPKDTEILHGACRGADLLAAQTAVFLGLKVRAFHADWRRWGYAAGPIRNRLMLDEAPDKVFAFHENLADSRGTVDCVGEAARRGIPVFVWGLDGTARCWPSTVPPSTSASPEPSSGLADSSRPPSP